MSIISRNFLLIALTASLVSLAIPALFTWAKPFIPILLGLIMFGMGLTMEFKEFLQVYEKKKLLLIGTLLQFIIMPSAAVLIGRILQVPYETYIGLVIVGACPGGTASNVIVYLGKGNVALSIVLTFISTVLAPVLTPLIIFLTLNQKVEVSFVDLLLSVLQIVALPLLAGLGIKHFFDRNIAPLVKYFPDLSTLCISLIIACVIGLNQQQILGLPYPVFLAVVLHNTIGLLGGYFGAKLFRSNESDARTIAVEVGMQNSGLGVALANQFFHPLSALPAALFSLWHNISGIVLARWWSRK